LLILPIQLCAEKDDTVRFLPNEEVTVTYERKACPARFLTGGEDDNCR